MSPDKKPEWFEMTDRDSAPQIRKITKSVPVSGLLAAVLIVGAGAVIGQPLDQSEIANTSTTAVALVEQQATPSQASLGMRTVALKNPSIAQLPTAGEDEDEDEDDYEDDYEDEDEDEDD